MNLRNLFKFFVVFFIMIYSLENQAQETSKTNALLELRPPLNITGCKVCVENNPFLTLPTDKKVKSILSNNVKKDDVINFPVEVLIDYKGVLKKITRTDSVSPLDDRLINSDFDKLLSLFENKKITDTKIFNSKDQYLKGVIILKLSSEDIKIINQ